MKNKVILEDSQIQFILSPVIGFGYTNTKISLNDTKKGMLYIIILPFLAITIYKAYH